MNLEDQIAQIREDGFCILEGVIPGEDVDRVRQSVEATVEEHCSKSPPENVGFVPSLIVHDQSFATYLADERLLGIAEAMLGKHIRISFTSAIINLTGNKRGDWHADWPFNQRNAGHFPEPYPNIVAHLTSLWMLSPFTSENGGTLIFPGSHLLNCNPTGTHEHRTCSASPRRNTCHRLCRKRSGDGQPIVARSIAKPHRPPQNCARRSFCAVVVECQCSDARLGR